MKKYKTWEVIKMFSENKSLKFKCDKGMIEYNGGYITWKQGCLLAIMEDTQEYEWELIQEPVTFEEVLNSNKRCRCESELIYIPNDDASSGNMTLDNTLYRYINGEYINRTDMLFVLGYLACDCDIKKIIQEGKWYLEED